MKQKSIMCIVAFLLVVGIGIYHSHSNSDFSDLSFENIEALASSESNGNKSCYSGGYACSIFDKNYNIIFGSTQHYPVYW